MHRAIARLQCCIPDGNKYAYTDQFNVEARWRIRRNGGRTTPCTITGQDIVQFKAGVLFTNHLTLIDLALQLSLFI